MPKNLPESPYQVATEMATDREGYAMGFLPARRGHLLGSPPKRDFQAPTECTEVTDRAHTALQSTHALEAEASVHFQAQACVAPSVGLRRQGWHHCGAGHDEVGTDAER